MEAIKYVSIYASETPSGVCVTGYDTYALKEHIKAAGGKWNAETKSWLVQKEGVADVLKAAQELSVTRDSEKKAARQAAKEKRAFDLTPEGRAQAVKEAKARVLAALELKKNTGAYHWICCEECEVIDWGRGHTSCKACAEGEGVYRNTFRVRGRIYTGD
jgi:hypothetical protein